MSGFGYNVLGFGANASGAAGEASDDQFNRVSFLSHFDGANNGVNNAFDDSSTSNHTITANGDVTQGSFGPFARPDGEWGVSMPTGPVINNNYAGSVEVASHSDFTLSGQYTIEFFVNSRTLKTPGGTNSVSFFALGSETNANSMNLHHNGTTIKYWDSSAYKTFGSSSDFVTNSWVHFAVCRNSSNVITCFVNGTALGTTFSDTTTPQGQVVIGAELYNTTRYNSVDGFISNFRILNGTCLYTSNFTAPTSALTAITNTKLLTCQSNRFVDNSASGHTITLTGAPAVTAFGPILTSAVYSAGTNGGSAYFDGTADALSIAASPISASGNFTLEGWVYPNTTSESAIVGQYQGRSTGRMIITTNAGLLIFFQNGVTGGQATVAPKQWAHFVLQRTGSNIAFYVNGTRILNNSAGNIAQDYLVIGTEDVNSGNYPNTMDGYISNIRITSSAVYSEGTSITVPTAPYSTVTNTNFLLNMADAQAIDSAAQSNLTLVGNANVSTDQAKFGNTSLHLTGSGDKANISGDLVNFGTSNFTLEGFFRIADMEGTDTYFFDGRDGTSGVLMPNILFDEDQNNHVRVYSHAYIITGTTDISLNTWYHLALCRSGSSLKLFLNGTQEGSTYTTLQDYVAGSFASIGGFAGGTAQSMVGFIDDFRISNMARYTSNFTPATEPFADKGQ